MNKYIRMFLVKGGMIALVGALIISPSIAMADSSGARNAGTGATGGGSGTSWVNAGNITSDDTSYASASDNMRFSSETLNGTNYGFSIPLDATIVGIQASIMRQSSSNSSGESIRDNSVRLIKNGVIVGNNKMIATDWPTSMTLASYGNSTDLWGTTWSPAEINLTNFGIALSVNNESWSTRTASVDYIQITVYYTPDATAPTLSEVSAVTTPTQDSTPDYTFSSSEAGTITYGGDCSSATVNAVAGNNTITFNTLVDGTYDNCTITVTDAANNASTALTVSSFTVAAPLSLTLSSADASPVNGPFSVTAIFTKAATGFEEGDVIVVNGTLSNFDGSDASYSFDITPNNPGTITIDVPVGAAVDANQISNLAAQTLIREYDADAFDTGLVTLSFDDGYKSAFNNVSLLGNYKSSWYITTEYMYGATACDGECYQSYMTVADVQTLWSVNHDISAHTRSHSDLTTTPNLAWEVDGSRLDLLTSLGIPANSLAYSYGATNITVMDKLKSAGYVGGRTVDGTYLNTKSTDRYGLFAKQVNSNTTIADVQGWIDEAIDNKQWLILVFHNITDTCSYPNGIDGSDAYCATPDNLSAVVGYLEANNTSVNVVTAKEGLAQMNNSPISDGIAPVIVQTDITVPAASVSGSTAPFTPIVTDSDSGLPATLGAYCTIPNTIPDPISDLIIPIAVNADTVYPIGTTTVTCTAADAGGNLGTITFNIIVNKLTQAIDFPAIADKTYLIDTTFDVVATANSVLPVAFSIVSGPATITGSTVTITGAGPIVVRASQAGNDAYAPAADVDITVNVIKSLGSVILSDLTHFYDGTAKSAKADTIPMGLTIDLTYNGSADLPINPGTYAVIATINDSNYQGSTIDNLIITDNVAPVIAAHEDLTVEATSPAGAVVNYVLPIVTDNFDTLFANCLPTPGSAFALGDTMVICTATDSGNNSSIPTSFKVSVVDTTKPVITLTGDNPQIVEAGTAYTEFGANANDLVDGIFAAIPNGTVDTTKTGDYIITYNATDSAGYIADAVTRAVTVVDSGKPQITLNGLNPLYLVIDSTYDEPGATAFDEIDGILTDSIVIGGDTVSTLVPATFHITYNVTDKSGNKADEMTRTIIVQDISVPIITLNGETTVNLNVGDTYTELGANATDNVDGDITSSIVMAGSVDTAKPGSYQVTYDATDSSGNPAVTVIRTVIVSDISAPVITLIGDDPLYLSTGDTYSEPGANALDDADGDISASIVIGGDTVYTTIPAVFHITYDVTDSTGNPAVQRVRTVNVEDNTSPVITLTGDATMTVHAGSAYTEQGATALDNIDGEVAVTISGDTVNTAIPGAYTIRYNAVDAAGNPALEVTRIVTIDDVNNPVITLIGTSTLNIALGTTFTDPGATALDNVDGDITSAIVATGDSVSSITPVGIYHIYYDVMDAAGNEADQAVRTVIISALTLAEEQKSAASTNSVTITWTTSHPATSRVLWDTVSHTTASSTEAGSPNYGYANTTTEDPTLVTAHSVTVTGLTANATYYFRPVSHGSPETLGEEITATTQAQQSSGGGGGGGGGGGSNTPVVIIVKTPTATTTATTTLPVATEKEEVKVLGIEGADYSGYSSLYGLAGSLADAISLSEAEIVFGQIKMADMSAVNKAIYDKIIKNFTGTLTDKQKYSISYFIQIGTPTTKKLGAGERAGVLNSYLSAYGRLPGALANWQDALKIANGRWPAEKSVKAEAAAKLKFKQIYKREANMANANDNAAVSIIAYGLRPVNRNTVNENNAIKSFKAIMHYSPISAIDWDMVRAIAYSGAKR